MRVVSGMSVRLCMLARTKTDLHMIIIMIVRVSANLFVYWGEWLYEYLRDKLRVYLGMQTCMRLFLCVCRSPVV